MIKTEVRKSKLEGINGKSETEKAPINIFNWDLAFAVIRISFEFRFSDFGFDK